MLDALEQMPSASFTGRAWRTTWEGKEPLIGSSAGGRWDPANDFEVLYTSLEPDGSLAEVYFHLSQGPIFSSRATEIHELTVNLKSVLAFDNTALEKLGVDLKNTSVGNYDATHAISSAAHFLEFQGIIVPSVRFDCDNLVVFLDQIDINEAIIAMNCKPINWPAWRTSQDS